MEPMVGVPGGWELVLIVLVIVLLFGARKLPELARGSGQALRIFKAETKGMDEDDDDSRTTRDEEPRPQGELGSGSTGNQQPLGEERNDNNRA
jgi:sec-independent protein translocase protein TatA